ncbi:MAG TPA: DMT family transporter [Povalibacter sp.]|nr:DMT family transporter [Povalibacter sp.]
MASNDPVAVVTASPQRTIGLNAALALVGLCAVWGLGQVAIKVGNSGISPLLQAGLRSSGATILLFAWCRWQNIRLFEKDGTAWPGVFAGLLFAVEFLLLYLGLQFTTAARSVLFLNTSPFFVALGAHLTIDHDKLTRSKVIGLTAAFAGVLVAFGEGLTMPSWHAVIGDAMTLAAAIAWGATTVLVKATKLSRIRPERTLMYQLVVSAVALLTASAAIGEPGFIDVTPLVMTALAYQIVVIAFASYLLWCWFIAHYPASQVASFVFLTPVFGVIAGTTLLHEPLSMALLAALVLIAAGIYIINRRQPVPVTPSA